jgi:eukaryotic-like serine/threonine-protein kinase
VGGRYVIVRPVGRGAAATVYHAHDRVLEEPVALKVLDAPGAGAGAAARLRAEMKLARRVTHPNVCRIHDYGEDGTHRYISMELIEGRNLRDVLAERGVLSPTEACAAVTQAAAALEAIHARGIVHRDVKTANLIQDAAGRVYVTDFGVATGGGPGTAGLAAGYVAGTPEYMSPEQAQGLRLDARSDLYALGIVLFELVTGEVPFRGGSTAETLVRHVQDPLPLHALAAARLPDDLRLLIERLLAKPRELRPDSAAEVAAALRSFAPAEGPARVAAGVGAATLVSNTLTLLPRARRPWVRPAAWAAASVALALAASLGPRPERPSPVPALAPAVAEAPVRRSTQPPALKAPPRRSAGASDAPATPEPAPPAATPEEREATPAAETDADPVAELPPAATPAVAETSEAAPVGHLQLGVAPWAEVQLDGVPVGETPLAPVALRAGTYTARLVHPDFRPFQRVVTIRPGQTTPLRVDLRLDGIRNR